MLKKLVHVFIGLLLVLPIIGAIGGIKFLQIRTLMAGGMGGGEPPVAVSLGEVRAEKWEDRLPAVGSVAPVQGVTIATEAEGVVREITFTPGKKVEAGEILVRLDTEVEQAQLRAAEAAVELARTSFKRTQDLFISATLSQAELDTAKANVQQAEAQADNIRALIARKTVVAPFAGRLGIRRINVGQFLNKGEEVVSLQSLDPVFVEFSLPQRRLGAVGEKLLVRVTSDAFADRVFEGRITAVNPDVDPVTRNFRLQATVPNRDELLRPGMFVSLDVVLPEQLEVLAIPTTAVVYAPYGNSVFAAVEGEPGPDGRKPLVAEQRTVRLGQQRGDFVVVLAGLAAGERIVTNGAFKLRQGSPLLPSDVGVTAPQLAPQPADM
jgi:membrane fusion protein (multidrug efflux system)